MPPLSELHPIVVHFVIALGVVGIALRVITLVKAPAWLSHTATLLLVLAAAGGVVAAKSGEEAHGPAERIPGARSIVEEHEEKGEQARNLLLVVAALELAALALSGKPGVARLIRTGSAAAGLAAGFVLYEAGEEGGELVYEYAGGVGTQSGDPADVQRLLVAGLFHQAREARAAKRFDESARLLAELARQRPDDKQVALLVGESRLEDEGDAAGALALVHPAPAGEEPAFIGVRRGLVAAKAFRALGQPDSARAVLAALKAKYPQSRAIQPALDSVTAPVTLPPRATPGPS